MGGEHSVWIYPWDLHDLGLAETTARMDEISVNMLSLATSYHAGRFLQPGNPRRRVYFPEDGTVYYSPSPERWAGHEIAPQKAAIVESEGDYLGAMIRQRDKGGWSQRLLDSSRRWLRPNNPML